MEIFLFERFEVARSNVTGNQIIQTLVLASISSKECLLATSAILQQCAPQLGAQKEADQLMSGRVLTTQP